MAAGRKSSGSSKSSKGGEKSKSSKQGPDSESSSTAFAISDSDLSLITQVTDPSFLPSDRIATELIPPLSRLRELCQPAKNSSSDVIDEWRTLRETRNLKVERLTHSATG